MAAEIIVIGGCIIDLVSYVPRFPYPGETLIGKKFHRAFGGKAANQCAMIAKLGVNTAMIAKVGDDSFGHEFLAHFKSDNIHCDHVTVDKISHTSTASISVTDSGENNIVNVFGAIDHLSTADVQNAAEELFPKAKMLICTYEGPKAALLTALKLAKNHKVQTVVNAAPLSGDHYVELFQYVDIICVNETEAGILCNKTVDSIEMAFEASKDLLDKVKFGVILTLGEKGAVFCTKGDPKPKHVTSPQVKAIDTTGAGDAFIGSFAYFHTNHPNLSLEEQIRRACSIASVSVMGEGTQKSFPKRETLPKELFE